jgi:hypothetical protein
VCGGRTALKEAWKDGKRMLHVFKCLSCEVEYPVRVNAPE